jgi:hypothetical protein
MSQPAEARAGVTLPPGQEGERHLADGALFQRDLFLYWNALRWDAILLTAARLVSKRALKRLNAQLVAPETRLEAARREDEAPRLFFLRTLLEDLKLVERRGDELRASAEPPTVPDFWRQPAEARAVIALNAWRESRRWDEVRDLGVIFPLDPPAARKALLAELAAQAEAAGDAWLSVARLVAVLQETRPNFLLPDRVRLMGVRSGYYEGHYYSSAGLASAFVQIERAFVAQVLAGPLHWLGIVDLGAQPAGGPRSIPLAERLVAVRVTPAGAAVLAGKSLQAVDAAGTLVVQPNFQLFAIGPVAETVLAELETFADRVRAERGSIEYHLSRKSVYRAQALGVGVDRILATLEREAHADLPQNVRRSLLEWGEHHERIVLREGVTLLQAATPDLLDRLLEDRTIAKFVGERVGPQTALLERGKPVAALKQALQQRDLLLATASSGRGGAIRFTDAGDARFVHAVPPLDARRRLARLADQDASGYHVTRAALHRLLEPGEDLPALLAEFAALNHGPLPEKFVQQVKAWGRYYGSAQLNQVWLLRLRDEKTLRELRGDPQLSRLLKPFDAAPGQGIAIVAPQHVEKVRARLRELGIETPE